MVRIGDSQSPDVGFEPRIRQFCAKHTSYACKPCYASLDSVSQNVSYHKNTIHDILFSIYNRFCICILRLVYYPIIQAIDCKAIDRPSKARMHSTKWNQYLRSKDFNHTKYDWHKDKTKRTNRRI